MWSPCGSHLASDSERVVFPLPGHPDTMTIDAMPDLERKLEK
jgi:hypothetical protein